MCVVIIPQIFPPSGDRKDGALLLRGFAWAWVEVREGLGGQGDSTSSGKPSRQRCEGMASKAMPMESPLESR